MTDGYQRAFLQTFLDQLSDTELVRWDELLESGMSEADVRRTLRPMSGKLYKNRPSALANAPDVQHLGLQERFHTFPAEIMRFQNLETLRISYGYSEVPLELASLPFLRELHLSGYELDTLPYQAEVRTLNRPDSGVLITKAQDLIAATELKATGTVSDADITLAQETLGYELPASYVALMRSIGDIGDKAMDDNLGGNGSRRDLRRIHGPRSAMKLTTRIHQQFGATGRHAARVNHCYFFLQWRHWNRYYGVDADGCVRELNLSRPGTVLRVSAASFSEWINDRWTKL